MAEKERERVGIANNYGENVSPFLVKSNNNILECVCVGVCVDGGRVEFSLTFFSHSFR